MGKWIHRMKNGKCIECKDQTYLVKKGGRLRCGLAVSNHQQNKAYRNLISKDRCSECGFKPKHVCQMDVDHKDGNHSNNAIENLVALCANCHRLKTHKKKI